MTTIVENADSYLKKDGFKKGLILGCVVLALNIFSYYFITGMTTSIWLIIGAPFIFAIVIPLIVSISFILDLRKSIGGYWIFKQAVTGIFIIFLTAYAVQTVGRDLIFAKFIEPNMVQKTGDAIMTATTAMLEKVGTDQSRIDEKMTGMQKEFAKQNEQTAGTVIQSLVITIILLFILALIFAAIFKKEPPVLAIDEAEEVRG